MLLTSPPATRSHSGCFLPLYKAADCSELKVWVLPGAFHAPGCAQALWAGGADAKGGCGQEQRQPWDLGVCARAECKELSCQPLAQMILNEACCWARGRGGNAAASALLPLPPQAPATLPEQRQELGRGSEEGLQQERARSCIAHGSAH